LAESTAIRPGPDSDLRSAGCSRKRSVATSLWRASWVADLHLHSGYRGTSSRVGAAGRFAEWTTTVDRSPGSSTTTRHRHHPVRSEPRRASEPVMAVVFPSDDLALVDPARVCRGDSLIQWYPAPRGHALVASMATAESAWLSWHGTSAAGSAPTIRRHRCALHLAPRRPKWPDLVTRVGRSCPTGQTVYAAPTCIASGTRPTSSGRVQTIVVVLRTARALSSKRRSRLSSCSDLAARVDRRGFADHQRTTSAHMPALAEARRASHPRRINPFAHDGRSRSTGVSWNPGRRSNPQPHATCARARAASYAMDRAASRHAASTLNPRDARRAFASVAPLSDCRSAREPSRARSIVSPSPSDICSWSSSWVIVI